MMDKVTSAHEVKELLVQACLRNLPAEILIADPPRHRHSRTRFLQLDGSGATTVLVDSPHGAGMTAVKAGAEVELQFQVSKSFYVFKTTVEEWTEFELTPGQILKALRLKMPTELSLRQERAHLRVFPDVHNSVHIQFRVLKSEPGNREEEENLPTFEGNIRDISVGGGGFFVSREQKSPARVGSLLKMEFRLPGADENVVLYAIIRNVREIPEHRAIVYGTQFIRTRESFEARRFVDMIAAYVDSRHDSSRSKES